MRFPSRLRHGSGRSRPPASGLGYPQVLRPAEIRLRPGGRDRGVRAGPVLAHPPLHGGVRGQSAGRGEAGGRQGTAPPPVRWGTALRLRSGDRHLRPRPAAGCPRARPLVDRTHPNPPQTSAEMGDRVPNPALGHRTPPPAFRCSEAVLRDVASVLVRCAPCPDIETGGAKGPARCLPNRRGLPAAPDGAREGAPRTLMREPPSSPDPPPRRADGRVRFRSRGSAVAATPPAP